jgi:hypothetical protein
MKSEDALEAWLVGAAQKIPFNGEWWLVADAKESPLTTRTFWRTLARVVKKHHLRRTRTNIWTRSGSRMATLIQGDILVHACASTVPLSKSGTTGSITSNKNTNKKEIKHLSSFASLTKQKSGEKFQEKVSGEEFDMGESAREIAARWQKQQAKDTEGVMAESIATLVTGKYTKAKLADLWKLLFCFYTEGYAKNLSAKEKGILFAWKTEWEAEFPLEVLFGEFLRDVFKDYSKVKAFVLSSSSFQTAPDEPEMGWLYHWRAHVVKWWVGSAKANEFKGATLS